MRQVTNSANPSPGVGEIKNSSGKTYNQITAERLKALKARGEKASKPKAKAAKKSES